MRLVFDAEANGFVEEATHIHCVVLEEYVGDRKWLFTDRLDELIGDYPGYIKSPLKGLEELLQQCDEIVCHNEIGYDLPLFKKLLDIDYQVGPDCVAGSPCKITDTLVLSRMYNPDRPMPEGCPDKIFNFITKENTYVGPHGLKSWSYRVSGEKPQVDDWRDQPIDTYVERCIADVENNKKVLKALEKEAGKHNWELATKIAMPTYHLMNVQEVQGVHFDMDGAEKLRDRIDEMMADIEARIEPELPPMNISESSLKYPPKNQFKKDGTPSALCLRYFGKVKEIKGIWHAVDHGLTLPHTLPLVTQQPMTMSNQGPLKEWLLSEGWEPEYWNYKKVTKKESEDEDSPYYKLKPNDFAKDARGKRIQTTPKLQEQGAMCKNLEFMQGDIAKEVIKWLSLRNRRSVIQSLKKDTGWLHHPRLAVDSKLPAASSGLTNTRRQKHRGVANIPKASESVLLGKEMRDLFQASPGRVFIGYDAAALEGRCEAHYTFPYDNGKYANEILEGDIHTANAVVFGLLTQDEANLGLSLKDKEDKSPEETVAYNKWAGARNGGGTWGGGAKSGKYCITYGGGGPKLASTLNLPEKQGKALFEAYWNGNLPLKNLKEDLTAEWKVNKKKKQYKDQWGRPVGWVTGIDGGKIIIRNEHSIVNAVFQNCGAMIMDLAGVYMQKWVTARGLDAQRVVYYHDEYVWESSAEDAPLVGRLGVKSIIKAGEFLKLNIALDAEAKIGQTWGDVH